MIRVRRHSTGFRLAGALVLLALVPSFAPDTWGLSCLHHASHGEPDEHQPPETRDHDAASPGHEPGHYAVGGAGSPGTRDPDFGAVPAHLAEASGHGSDHHDPQAPPCTCAGECSTSTGQSAPVQTRVFGLPPAYPEAARWSRAVDAPAAERTPYLLPFANAPPLS